MGKGCKASAPKVAAQLDGSRCQRMDAQAGPNNLREARCNMAAC